MQIPIRSLAIVMLTSGSLMLPPANALCTDPDSLTISLDGACPGLLVFHWEGATPNRTAGIAFSTERGNFVIPGWCEGTILGLGPRGLRAVAHAPTGPQGSGSSTRRATAFACGGYLQMIVQDGYPCTTSNVVQIPQ